MDITRRVFHAIHEFLDTCHVCHDSQFQHGVIEFPKNVTWGSHEAVLDIDA
jgi:hypothetical protein